MLSKIGTKNTPLPNSPFVSNLPYLLYSIFQSTFSGSDSWAWCWVPVIPATQETEARESLEPGGVEVAVSEDHATSL